MAANIFVRERQHRRTATEYRGLCALLEAVKVGGMKVLQTVGILLQAEECNDDKGQWQQKTLAMGLEPTTP